MIIQGWGRYPIVDAQVWRPRSIGECLGLQRQQYPLIASGQRRSYGDSSLAPLVLETRYLDRFQAFDPDSGLLRCAAGVTLDEIIRCFLPRGWFLPVTPGTRFVSLGGAIASDVHGKNHHLDGSFSGHVEDIDLLLGNGERVRVSRTEHAELFAATCGGMGLTGIILGSSLRLKRVASASIVETTLKAADLASVLALFDEHADSPYSVAWIDCQARGARLGRSLLMLGAHAATGLEPVRIGPAPAVPFDMPRSLLNRYTVGAFNALYHAQVGARGRVRTQPLLRYFYPLDGIAHWNRLYGRDGFLQYQFVLPREGGAAGLRRVLERVSASGEASFLAVLKAFGPGNGHPLSFPREGYTLALDFHRNERVLRMLDALDRIVLEHGGRLYLAKDARMSEATFKAGYPLWEAFEQVRARYHAHGRFASLQSKRLGLQ